MFGSRRPQSTREMGDRDDRRDFRRCDEEVADGRWSEESPRRRRRSISTPAQLGGHGHQPGGLGQSLGRFRDLV